MGCCGSSNIRSGISHNIRTGISKPKLPKNGKIKPIYKRGRGTPSHPSIMKYAK